MSTTVERAAAAPVLEPEAKAFAEATADPPFIFQLPPDEGRRVLDDAQSGKIEMPDIDEEWIAVPGGATGDVVRELAVGNGAAVVFPEYSRTPEARCPVAIEQNYAVARWIVRDGAAKGLEASRLAVAGDSVGGNMTAAATLTAKERGDVHFLAQLLFYPVTDANFDCSFYPAI